MANISQVWHVIYRVVLVSSIISLLLIHATLQILNFILRTQPKSLTLFIFSLSIQPSSSCSTSTSQVPGKLAAKCPGVGEVLHGHDFTLRSYMSSFNGTLPILAMGDVAHMISRTGSPPFLCALKRSGSLGTRLPSYHVVYRYVTVPLRLLALWDVPYGAYVQLRVSQVVCSLNLSAMLVCMAKYFQPGHPLLYPALWLAIT